MHWAFAIFISICKLYGPHFAALYTRLSKLPNLTPLTHHFQSPGVDNSSKKFMPGGSGYEIAHGITGVLEYLLSISPISGPTSSTSVEDTGSIYSDPETHTRLKATYAAIAKYDRTLVERLLGHLTSEKLAKRGVRVLGEETIHEGRVPTISFVVVKGDTGDAISGKDIAKVFDAKGGVSCFLAIPASYLMRVLQLGIRYGHCHAYTLVDTLRPKVDVDNDVVRISLLHYSTIEEVDRLIEVLDEALGVR